jgi:hypothetical protein
LSLQVQAVNSVLKATRDCIMMYWTVNLYHRSRRTLGLSQVGRQSGHRQADPCRSEPLLFPLAGSATEQQKPSATFLGRFTALPYRGAAENNSRFLRSMHHYLFFDANEHCGSCRQGSWVEQQRHVPGSFIERRRAQWLQALGATTLVPDSMHIPVVHAMNA